MNTDKLKSHPRRNVRSSDNDVRVLKDIIATPQNVGARQFKFVISTSDVDTSNDVIDQTGWKLDHFLRNPVVLYNHQDQILPVGKCVWIAVEDNKLKAIVEFATQDQNPLADQVYKLISGGFLNATSVGFSPIEMSESNDPARGADTMQSGIDFHKQELFEFSIVNLPANPYALIEPGQRMSANIRTKLNNHRRELRKRQLDLYTRYI